MRGACNMGARDSPDMCALGPRASGMHVGRVPRTFVIRLICMPSALGHAYRAGPSRPCYNYYM